MAEDFGVVRRNIIFFLQSLRTSLDRPFRSKPDISDQARRAYLNSMMMVEEARVLFNSYTRFREEPSAPEWAEARRNLVEFVNTFLHSNEIDPQIFERRFVAYAPARQDRDNPSAFVRKFYTDVDEGRLTSVLNVGEALIEFSEYLGSQSLDFATVQGELSFSQLDRIVPQQQIAPAKFEVRENKVCILHQENEVSLGDTENVAFAREHLEAAGREIIENLESSNCDRRLLNQAKELHRQVTEQESIVKVGLSNLAFNEMSRQFEPELPEAVNAMVASYCSATALYTSQFPEWDKFIQNAAAVQLEGEDLAEIQTAADELIQKLEDNPELADPEVPRTISLIRELISSPGKASKRAAFAVIRTIENLVSSIVHFSLKFSSRTLENVVEAGSSAASKIVVALLSVAMIGATGIGNAALNAGTPWVKQAAEIVQKQLTKIQE